DNDIVELFSDYWDDIDAIVGFEKGGLAYDPDLPQFSTLWEVDHLSGYWINVNNVDGITLSFSGLAVPDNAGILLDAGWNLVSYLPDVSLEPSVALAGIEDDGNLLWAYGAPDGNIQVYQPGGGNNQLESMDPCYGYWLKVSHSDVLHYATADSSPPALPPSYTRPNRSLAVSNTPVDVEATTNWVNVYSGDLKLDGRPVPAGAEITAHAVADDSKVGGCIVREDGVFGFMSVYAGDGSTLRPGESFYLSVDGAETIETFEWTGFGDRIEVLSLSATNGSDNTLPAEYSLHQNYPNPFNPATHIRFTLPSAGEARVEIFNILGKLIAVPFDGQAVAGENSVIWDGRSTNGDPVATGVYLYRLTAGEFTETKKMMLLK
ncbi:MAG: T9SS type A sorting domain-containing protein, partial [Candidatus Zixiibacteriota bacterium]